MKRLREWCVPAAALRWERLTKGRVGVNRCAYVKQTVKVLFPYYSTEDFITCEGVTYPVIKTPYFDPWAESR